MATIAKAGSALTGVTPAQIRNVVLVGHAGAGKTTLVEALLLATGAISRAGRIEAGSTVCDHDPVEHRLGRSVALAVASTAHRGVRLSFIDTPGHADFVGEVRAGLRAADAALFVVSAVDGVDGTTKLLWEECAAVGMPRAVVITHLDHQRADHDEAVAICQRVFGDGVQPLQLPLLGDDEAPAGLLDLITEQIHTGSGPTAEVRPAEPEHRTAVADQRAALIEGIIQESEDDSLLDRWISGETIAAQTLIADLHTAVARGTFYPVLPVVSPSGLGITELLDLLVSGFPSPEEHPLPAVTTPDGDPREPIACDPAGPLVAEVVKTTTDPYLGRLSIVRVFSGTLEPDATVHVSGHFARFSGAEHGHPDHDVDERIGAISHVLGATMQAVDRARAGDIVAVARLSRAETGDTLSGPASPVLMEPWHVPEPQLPTALTAKTSADDDKLMSGLSRLVAEDPTVRVEVTPDTHQLVLWTMGEAHRDLVLDRLKSRHSVAIDTAAVKVSLRETLRGKASGHGRHVKQSGGHGQYAVCDIEVEPLPEGSGFEFVDKVVGGAVPRNYIPSVEKGVRAQLERGVAAGYPVVDLRVTLVGGKAHSVDSSDAAFQTAGALALKEAAAAAGVALLEPVDLVQITVDDEYVGSIMSDLNSRRGRVLGTESVGGGRTRVDAEVPGIELTRYATDLRSLAHGTAMFSRGYARHAPMPQSHADKILTGS